MSFCPDSAKWFLARDLFLGINYKKQNLAEALKLASECKHKDAQWLCKCFPNGPPETALEARDVFLLLYPNDSRAITFAGIVNNDEYELIERALRIKPTYVLAFRHRDIHFDQLIMSDNLLDPYALLRLAACYDPSTFVSRSIVKKDEDKAKSLYKQAIAYGNVEANIRYVSLLSLDSPERYSYYLKAYNSGYYPFMFTNEVHDVIRLYNSNQSNCKIVFHMSKFIYLHTDINEKRFFNFQLSKFADKYYLKCIELYKECHKKALSAVLIWSLFAKKYLSNLVNHNIRRMILEFVFEDEWMWMNDISGKLTTP